MGHFRFWRRIRVAPGVSVNLSKSGASLSMGPRGAKMTVGRRGLRKTAGIPGTGLYYTTNDGWGSGRGGKRGSSSGRGREGGAGPVPKVPAHARLKLGFFKRLVTPASEQAFVDGCRALALGDAAEAAGRLEEASAKHPDGAFLAGTLHLEAERYGHAAHHLALALSAAPRLGRLFGKYGIDASVSIPVADGVSAVVGPRPRGVRLALAEAHQALERWSEVIEDLEALLRADPDDMVVRLSLAEILIDCRGTDQGALKRVLRLSQRIRNESPIHGGLLLQRARALRRLEMPTAARDVLTPALRRRKGRPPDLLNALRYERAMAYEELGRRANARRDLERIFADDPDFEDVAQRLKVSFAA